jgi:hypothetical protein
VGGTIGRVHRHVERLEVVAAVIGKRKALYSLRLSKLGTVMSDADNAFTQAFKIAIAGRAVPPSARKPLPGYVGAIGDPFRIPLDEDALRWAAAEGVSEAVIAAIYLLPSTLMFSGHRQICKPSLLVTACFAEESRGGGQTAW